jgi:hypothetical protein
MIQKEELNKEGNKAEKKKTSLIVPVAKVVIGGVVFILVAGVIFRATAWTIKGYNQMDKARTT